jgi:CBS-domain-containing membrane protein
MLALTEDQQPPYRIATRHARPGNVRCQVRRTEDQVAEKGMPVITEVLRRHLGAIAPEASVMEAARLMNELNVGALPVCDGDALVGMIIDRDIALRANAHGRAPRGLAVAEVMRWCDEVELGAMQIDPPGAIERT